MPIGDSDLLSGIFFADFGQPVVFNAMTARGNLDAPGRDATFGKTDVQDVEYCLILASGAFSPMPKTASRLTVAGSPYSVRSVMPLDDGALVELRLKALQEKVLPVYPICIPAPPVSAPVVTQGDAMPIPLVASVTISQYQAVSVQNGSALVADSSVSLLPCIGIAQNGAMAGGQVMVQSIGEIVNPGWNWTSGGAIYVGAGGALTQSPPLFGYQQIVAFALSATAILIDVQEQILFG